MTEPEIAKHLYALLSQRERNLRLQKTNCDADLAGEIASYNKWNEDMEKEGYGVGGLMPRCPYDIGGRERLAKAATEEADKATQTLDFVVNRLLSEYRPELVPK